MPAVLVVADPEQMAELATALRDPLPYGRIDLLVSSGGDDTIDLFESRAPRVVVLTATLEMGDAKSLIEAIREMVPRERVVIVLVGDDAGGGPVRTALDAIDMKPDRFVSRPLAAKALRFAVQSGLENVARALGEPARPGGTDGRSRMDSGQFGDDLRTTQPITSRAPMRVAIAGTPGSPFGTIETAAGSSPVILIGPRPPAPETGSSSHDSIGDDSADVDIDSNDIDDDQPAIPRTGTPLRGSSPTITRAVSVTSIEAPSVARAPTDRGIGIAIVAPAVGEASAPVAPAVAPRAKTDSTSPELRARWEALADSIAVDGMLDDDDVELDQMGMLDDGAAPLPPIEIGPRKKGSTNPEFVAAPPIAPWRPGTTSALPQDDDDDGHHIDAPTREPTLIIADPPASPSSSGITGTFGPGTFGATGAASSAGTAPLGTLSDPHPSLVTPLPSLATPAPSRIAPDPSMAERGPRERWSQPVLLSALIDRSRDSSRELLANVKDDLAGIDDIDDDIIVGRHHTTPPPNVMRSGQLQALEDLMEPIPPPELDTATTTGTGSRARIGSNPSINIVNPDAPDRLGAGRDFARQLRAKMSQMAQRLFQTDSPAQPSVDVRPRHDHHTEIDLAALGEELVLGGGVTEIESRAHGNVEPKSHTTSPGSWDTQVRERGLPDTGELVRGVSDASMIIAKMFAQSFTGRVSFRRDGHENIVYFDQGRPVFASSNEPGDRMGELLVREGKITASQYERCQIHVAQSGRRMGEILVDFGYLKRRELLPAVRRHVEDILYSLFGWDRGVYQVIADPTASAERIRLSRHPASLVLEGIRRKLGRTTLEKMLGPSSTVIEVPDRERLGGIINVGDLAPEERAALGGFDGQADLAQVARTTGVDVADVLPLAWGLCVLGLATARRTEPDINEESTALVGETDLAIDRERVRARWQLVTDADYFALLGVRRDATGFEIRRAYQAARRDFASDCFPSDLRRELARELEDIASVLDEAFRVLRDDRLRMNYLTNLVE